MAVAVRSPVVQVTNVCPTATSEQLTTLFGHIGPLQDFIVYPSDDKEELASKVAFVKYEDQLNAEVALHLNNTVFLDRALIVLPLADGKENIPDDKYANLIKAPANTAAGVLPRTADWPLDVISMVVGRPGEQIIHTIEPRLSNLAFPLYPPLPATTDGSRIEEIRRTILVTNLDPKTTGDQVLEFFNAQAEVRCVRMAGTEYDRAAYVEFTHQPSIIKAFGLMGATLNNRQAAKLAAAKAAAAAVGEGKSDGRRRSHSRSRGRHRSSSRNYRTRSRDRKRSRSRKSHVRRRSRTPSRSRGRKRYSRSRSHDRRRNGRSRSRRRYRSGSRSGRRYSRSRSRGRRDRREKEKERASDRVSRDKNYDRERRDRDRARDKSRRDEKVRRHRDTSPKVSQHSMNTGKAEDGERKRTVSSEQVTIENSESKSKHVLKSENNTSGSDSNGSSDVEQPSLHELSNGSVLQDGEQSDLRPSSKPTVVGVKLAGPEDMDNLSPQKASFEKQAPFSGDSSSSDDAMDTET